MESDLAWAPTHTLINPFTEVVDHSAANSILAAGLVGHPAAVSILAAGIVRGHRDRKTQNSLPSGSAMTTQETSC